MKKINVLQVIYRLGDGGVEAMLMDIYRNIDRKKIRFIFMVQEESTRYVEEINRLGGKVIKITPMKKQGIISYIKNIRYICQREKIDVVHTHNLTQNFVVLFAAYLSKIRIRISHSHLTTAFSKKTELVMPIIRFLTNFFATNRLACGNEAGKFLYGRKKYEVINNAIDVEKFSNATMPDLEGPLKDIKDRYTIIHVGRLCEQKNHDFIIDIAKKLKYKGRDFIILCCGSGPLESDIRDKIQYNKLEHEILMLGSRDDIHKLMKFSDLFILPSLYEGLPVTAIEAQATGTKCLLSDTIDHACDLGIDLVEFISINKGVDLWVDKIEDYMKNEYEKNAISRHIFISKGYDATYNSKIIEKIYCGKDEDKIK